MIKIQARARKLKAEDPELKHKDAIKLASSQLRIEGVFKGPAKKPRKKNKEVEKRVKKLNTENPTSTKKENRKLAGNQIKIESLFKTGSCSKPCARAPKRGAPRRTKKSGGSFSITAADLLNMPSVKKIVNRKI